MSGKDQGNTSDKTDSGANSSTSQPSTSSTLDTGSPSAKIYLFAQIATDALNDLIDEATMEVQRGNDATITKVKLDTMKVGCQVAIESIERALSEIDDGIKENEKMAKNDEIPPKPVLYMKYDLRFSKSKATQLDVAIKYLLKSMNHIGSAVGAALFTCPEAFSEHLKRALHNHKTRSEKAKKRLLIIMERIDKLIAANQKRLAKKKP